MTKYLLLLAIILSACDKVEKTPSSKLIESSADAGGALAIYRHMDKMDGLAREIQMIHPVEVKRKNK